MMKKIFLVMLMSAGFAQATRSCRTAEEAALERLIVQQEFEEQREAARRDRERREQEARQARMRFLKEQQLARASLEFDEEWSARKDIMFAYDQASTAILALMDQAKDKNPDKFKHQRKLVGNVTPAAQTPNCFYMPEHQRSRAKKRSGWSSDSE